MSKTLRIVHICDHVVRSSYYDYLVSNINRDSERDSDIIDNKNIVSKILEVRQNDNIFIPEVDYKTYAHNKIRWVGIHKPEDNSNYFIKYQTVHNEINNYTSYNCSKCRGNGWYVSLLEDNVNKLYESGDLRKLTQDYIKILLTHKEGEYGTDLLKYSGKEIYSIDHAKSDIISILHEAEDQLRNMQLETIMDGFEMSEHERLNRIEILDIDYIKNEMKFTVDVVLYNQSKKSASMNLKV